MYLQNFWNSNVRTIGKRAKDYCKLGVTFKNTLTAAAQDYSCFFCLVRVADMACCNNC